MEIYNIETKEVTNVSHPYYEIDVMVDIIGNTGTEDVCYNDEEDRYEADTATIEWWQNYANEDAEAMELRDQALEVCDFEEVHGAWDAVILGDMETDPRSCKSAMEELIANNDA